LTELMVAGQQASTLNLLRWKVESGSLGAPVLFGVQGIGSSHSSEEHHILYALTFINHFRPQLHLPCRPAQEWKFQTFVPRSPRAGSTADARLV
jgi:hypothetical protein